jgi:hypothetical protein
MPGSIIGGSDGSEEESRTLPREDGVVRTLIIVKPDPPGSGTGSGVRSR